MPPLRNTRPPIQWTRVAWGVLGIPAAILTFLILVTIVLPTNGRGLHDLVFADTSGQGSLRGAWLLFAWYAFAEVLVMILLRRTEYPGPWYLRAAIVGTAAELLWVPFFRSPGVSRAFLVTGIGLGLLLLVVATAASFAMTSGSLWSRRDMRWGSPTSVAYQVAIGWACSAAGIGVLLWVILCTAWQWGMSYTSGLSGGDVTGTLPIVILFEAIAAGTYAVLAVPPYSVLFLLWLRFARRHPAVEATPVRRLLSAFGLALPMAAVIVYRLAPPRIRLEDWATALQAISLAILTCWGAVWIPRWEKRVRSTRVPPRRMLNVFRVFPANAPAGETVCPDSGRTDGPRATKATKRPTWRSAVLLLGALPYVTCTTNSLMPWSVQPVSSRASAAISIGMCLLLPLLPGLFLLQRVRRGRWWIKIPALLLIMLPVALLWRSTLSDAIQCYHAGCDTDPNLIERFPTAHGTLLVYNVPSDPLSADGARVVQEQILRYGLKRTRILYYRDGGHDVSLRLIDADHVEITSQSPYADRSTPAAVIRSLR